MQFVSTIPVSRILDELCIISDLVPSEGGVPAYKCFIHSLFNWYHRYRYILWYKKGNTTSRARLCTRQLPLGLVLDSHSFHLWWWQNVHHNNSSSTYCLLSIERDNKIVGQLIRSLQLSLKQVATSHNLLCVLKKYRSGSGGMA